MLAQVESVGVPGREAHHTRSFAPDPDRRPRALRRLRRADRVVDAVVLPVVRGALLSPEASGDLESLLQLIDALARRREAVSIGAVLLFFPSRADAELESAT